MVVKIRSLPEAIIDRPDSGNQRLMLSYIDALTESVAQMSVHDREGFGVALTELRWANDCLARTMLNSEQAEQSIAAMGDQDKGIERRLTKRYGADRSVSLRIDTTPLGGKLLDISQTGARLAASSPMKPGRIFRLKLSDDAEVTARVVWSNEEMIGATFLNHLSHLRQVSRFIISHGY